MHPANKPLLTTLNQHLTCKLCKGYFIDATTIIECLHSFCRSCIVKYLQKNKYCPVCDVQVHKTKPLLNIRPDRILQDLVYKLVPRLLQNELQRRRDFALAHPDAKANVEQLSCNYQHIITGDEFISLKMCYFAACKKEEEEEELATVRYLRCPAGVSMCHLEKLIRAKYGLFQNYQVDILYKQKQLDPQLTLMDVAYITSWKRKEPMELCYRIYEQKKPKIEKKEQEWKEVQLRISENGEMSIIQETAELVNNNDIVTVVDEVKEVKELPSAPPPTPPPPAVTKSESDEKGVKRKLSDKDEQPTKTAKQTVLNHSIGLQNLSNNHPLKKHAQETPKPAKPVNKACYMPKPIINVPKPSTSTKTCSKTPPPAAAPPAKLIKTKPSTPIGYKTLRDPPKSWNSQIAKANVNKPITSPDLKNVRPAKFFKMRNNLPRYLGNPASGVKPMYQVHVSPEKNPEPKGEIKKHSIVKIDPKTLKPISEKAPETSSLSNVSDLKISTSSVPIFNPLKLQSKVSPPAKRDKPSLSLNFTPPNPFIPNLASPNLNPNPFLCPPGFSPYDPRVMAAYQHFFYGQRMALPPPPGLSLDLNRRSPPKLPPPRKIKEVGKGEKSLENTVEKLTQNRVKEIKNEEEKNQEEKTNGEVEKKEEKKENENVSESA